MAGGSFGKLDAYFLTKALRTCFDIEELDISGNPLLGFLSD